MSPVDLHTHSNKSDGTLTPSELVRYASQKGLSAIALTDHDTVDGIDEAIHEAGMLGQECGSADRTAPAPGTAVEVIPGIEVYYSGHKPADTAYLCRIADQYGLLYCGGSDFHGSRKKNLDLGTGYGHLYVPDSILPPIREAAEKLRSRK